MILAGIRHKNLYKQWFDFEDVADNRELFTKLPIMIIDNKVIFDYKIFLDRGYMKFKLPYKSDFVYKYERNLEKDRLIYQDHQITFQIIDNVYWARHTIPQKQDWDASTGLYYDQSKQVLTVPYCYFGSTADYYEIYNTFPHSKGKTGLYFAVINFSDEVRPELGSFLLDVECYEIESRSYINRGCFKIHLDDETANKYVEKGFPQIEMSIVWYNNWFR